MADNANDIAAQITRAANKQSALAKELARLERAGVELNKRQILTAKRQLEQLATTLKDLHTKWKRLGGSAR